MSKEEMKALGYQIIDYIVEHRAQLDQQRVYNRSDFQSLEKLLPNQLPLKGEAPQRCLKRSSNS